MNSNNSKFNWSLRPLIAASVAIFGLLLTTGCVNNGNFASKVEPPLYPVAKLATPTSPATTDEATRKVNRDYLRDATGNPILAKDGTPFLTKDEEARSQGWVYEDIQLERLRTAAMAKGATGYLDASGVWHSFSGANANVVATGNLATGGSLQNTPSDGFIRLGGYQPGR